jgi:hypothetical protein
MQTINQQESAPLRKRGRPRRIPVEELKQYRREYMKTYNSKYYTERRDNILLSKHELYIKNKTSEASA